MTHLLSADELIERFARVPRVIDGLEDFDFDPELEAFDFGDPVARISDPEFTEVLPERPRRPPPEAEIPEVVKEQRLSRATGPETGQDLGEWMSRFENGQIPQNALTPIEGETHFLREDAAKAYKAMQRAAKRDGIDFSVTDSYRTLESQQALAKQKGLYSQGGLAAVPGTSNHGWGIAIDVNVNDPKVSEWLQKNGGRFGYKTIPREPWHWEYKGGFKAAYKQPKGKPKARKTQDAQTVAELVRPISRLVAPLIFADTVAQVRAPKRGARDIRNLEGGGLGFAPARYRKLFVEAGQKTGLPPRLLAYVAQKESGFNPKAVSSAGAQGIMQVMPLHGLDKPFNARANILKGAEILASNYELFNGNLRFALAAYNVGPNRAPGRDAHDANIWAIGLNYADAILDSFRRAA